MDAVVPSDELFDANGSLVAELAALSPTGDKRMGSTPYANGGRLRVDLPMPPLEKYALPIQSPGSTFHETTRVLGELLRDIYAATETEDSGGIFRLFCPDETASNRLGAVFETTDRCWQLPITDYDDGLSADGRVMEVLSEHLCEGCSRAICCRADTGCSRATKHLPW